MGSYSVYSIDMEYSSVYIRQPQRMPRISLFSESNLLRLEVEGNRLGMRVKTRMWCEKVEHCPRGFYHLDRSQV